MWLFLFYTNRLTAALFAIYEQCPRFYNCLLNLKILHTHNTKAIGFEKSYVQIQYQIKKNILVVIYQDFTRNAWQLDAKISIMHHGNWTTRRWANSQTANSWTSQLTDAAH